MCRNSLHYAKWPIHCLSIAGLDLWMLWMLIIAYNTLYGFDFDAGFAHTCGHASVIEWHGRNIRILSGSPMCTLFAVCVHR